MLRTITAHNFSSLIWPDGSAPAALASLLFDPWSHKSLEKQSESRLSDLFAHLPLLSSLCFSSLIFSLLFFSSLTLPTSAFPSVHIVGSLTSTRKCELHKSNLRFHLWKHHIGCKCQCLEAWHQSSCPKYMVSQLRTAEHSSLRESSSTSHGSIEQNSSQRWCFHVEAKKCGTSGSEGKWRLSNILCHLCIIEIYCADLCST